MKRIEIHLFGAYIFPPQGLHEEKQLFYQIAHDVDQMLHTWLKQLKLLTIGF